ncbi:PP2C family protein-serine/threonine phosphatase [Bacteroides heparinolyticus]|uniref:PP2C family protein-serine/threonine phosphatase n=1 Tax=Prevotella heparinolytica TaxID=28113 RepID=UPI00359F7E9F
MRIRIESISISAGKENGDYILHQELSNGATLILLADGIGGLSLPWMASKIICEAISEYFVNTDVTDCTEHIRRSITYADNRLADSCKEKKCKMGVALLLAYISDDMLFYTSLGNVRLYYRDEQGDVIQLTNDNVIVQGIDTYLITRIAGRGFRTPIQVQYLPLNVGDSLLLCSDGYYTVQNIFDCFSCKDLPISPLIEDDSSVVRIKVI